MQMFLHVKLTAETHLTDGLTTNGDFTLIMRAQLKMITLTPETGTRVVAAAVVVVLVLVVVVVFVVVDVLATSHS